MNKEKLKKEKEELYKEILPLNKEFNEKIKEVRKIELKLSRLKKKYRKIDQSLAEIDGRKKIIKLDLRKKEKEISREQILRILAQIQKGQIDFKKVN